MEHVNFTVEVHCQRPDWSIHGFPCNNSIENHVNNSNPNIPEKNDEDVFIKSFEDPISGNTVQRMFNKFNLSRYRIYVNNDLITERDWNWDNNTFLNENIWVTNDSNETYIVSLIPLVYIPQQAVFKLNNLRVFTDTVEIKKINDLSISFKI